MIIEKGRTAIKVGFPYDARIKDLIKTIDGYAWNNAAKRWEFPLDVRIIRMLLEKTADLNPIVEQKVYDWLSAAEARFDRATAAAELKDAEILAPNQGQLWPYQRVGVNFLAEAERGILGDEMGLGKTVQAILTIKELELREDYVGKHLIILPNSVKYNWVEEIERWYGPANVHVMHSCKELDGDNTEPGFYIINWDKLHLRLAKLTSVKWDVVIGDESHRMKNAKSKRTKAMLKIGKSAKHRFLLSGTPIKNDVSDLWTQLHFIEPSQFSSYWKFMHRYVVLQEDFFGGLTPIGLQNEDELKQVLKPILLGRKLEDADLQLPPVRHQTIKVELGDRQRKAYEEMLHAFVAMIEQEDSDEFDVVKAKNWLTQALRLKQICGSMGIFSDSYDDSAKIDALDELMAEAPDEKFVVMSQFRTMVDQVVKRWEKQGVPYARMDGANCLVWTPGEGTKPFKTRQDLINEFQNRKDLRAFIATTQAGGEGITLTSARYFAFLDLLWTPGDNDQAWKRIHRISQTRSCIVYHILAKDTIDFVSVLPKLRKKRDIINAILGKEVAV